MTRSRHMVFMVFSIFFVISFTANILGPIIPDIIESFHLSLFAVALLPFSFFIPYGILSIPAGFLLEKFGEKPIILGSFSTALIGSLLFAWVHDYSIAVGSLFLIGSGMAALEVAIVPLLREAGGGEHFAFNSAFAQLVFGIASFVSPQLFSHVVHNLQQPNRRDAFLVSLSQIVPSSMQWVSMYWIIALVIAAITLMLALVRFPKVEHIEGEAPGTVGMYWSLLRRPVVWMYFLSVFFYVGSEQGTANWISEFLWKYHGYDPHTTGATAVAWFWGLLTVGCLTGMILLKLFDSRSVLRVFGIGSLLCLSGGLFGPSSVAKFSFSCIGLFASVMWPIIISLALNSVLDYHGPLAGILCSGIIGGAILPLLIGRVADSIGLRTGMCLLYLSFSWVLSVSFWAKPLIANERYSHKPHRSP